MTALAAAALAAPVQGPAVAVAGEPVTLVAASEPAVWWRRVAVEADYDNERFCGGAPVGCAQPIDYVWQRAAEGRTWRFVAEPGTHELAVSGGELPCAVQHRLIVRRDDSYVGFASELIGVPFVFSPARGPAGHQTDLGQATDCAALVVYGQRRLGRSVPYVSPEGLWRYLRPVDELPVQRGDVLHWGWQTALVAEDRPPIGVLDGGDLLLLAWRGHAEERTLGTLPFAGTPLRRLRWPEPAGACNAPDAPSVGPP